MTSFITEGLYVHVKALMLLKLAERTDVLEVTSQSIQCVNWTPKIAVQIQQEFVFQFSKESLQPIPQRNCSTLAHEGILSVLRLLTG